MERMGLYPYAGILKLKQAKQLYFVVIIVVAYRLFLFSARFSFIAKDYCNRTIEKPFTQMAQNSCSAGADL
jgi:hypothetical protein